MDNRSLSVVQPQKLISQVKTHSQAGTCYFKTPRLKFNSLVFLELLVNLVTQILECAGM